jgi:cell division protein FtsZ
MIDGLINFNEDEVSPTIIKVIGVGGGGGNAVEYMCRQGIHDVDFVVCNTDQQVLADCEVPQQIQLGKLLTQGGGAGNCPEKGEAAAYESLEEIQAMLRANTKMVFITATMGGGTGTGAAPVIAKTAKEMGILTVGVVTIPMRLDGPKRVRQAREGIKRMQDYVDALIVIDNEKIKKIYGMQTLTAAFDKANDVLKIAVKGIAEIVTLPGYVNVDFADVTTVVSDSNMAIVGAARVSGTDRASRVIAEALNSPLLNKNDISGARNILLNIMSGVDDDEISMDELTKITSYVIDRVGDTASVIWGVGTDESLKGELSVTIIATGFPFTEVDEMFPVDGPADDPVLPPEPVGEEPADMLKEEDVPLQPDLLPEKIHELKVTPAYTRRHVKVDKI